MIKPENNLTLYEIFELLKKEVDIYNAINWKTRVHTIKNDERSWYYDQDTSPVNNFIKEKR
jgi:hypothetical protein